MKLGEIVNDLLSKDGAYQVIVKRMEDNPVITHTITVMNTDKFIFFRVLYDERNDTIFKEEEKVNFLGKFDWNKVSTKNLYEIHRDEMIRLVNGGLKWSISDYRVINKENFAHASKRITANIFKFLGTRISFPNKDGEQAEYFVNEKYNQ